jgi:hypothetical protein
MRVGKKEENQKCGRSREASIYVYSRENRLCHQVKEEEKETKGIDDNISSPLCAAEQTDIENVLMLFRASIQYTFCLASNIALARHDDNMYVSCEPGTIGAATTCCLGSTWNQCFPRTMTWPGSSQEVSGPFAT